MSEKRKIFGEVLLHDALDGDSNTFRNWLIQIYPTLNFRGHTDWVLRLIESKRFIDRQTDFLNLNWAPKQIIFEIHNGFRLIGIRVHNDDFEHDYVTLYEVFKRGDFTIAL